MPNKMLVVVVYSNSFRPNVVHHINQLGLAEYVLTIQPRLVDGDIYYVDVTYLIPEEHVEATKFEGWTEIMT